jgi:lamin tail-like protein
MKINRTTVALLTTVGLVVGTAALAAPASAASKIQIVKVRFDSAGSDFPVTNKKLNDEYVVIKNTDSADRSLTGWTLVDTSNHWYTFPATTIKAGATLKVRTGSGSDTSKNKYQDRGYYVWNNTSDTAYLRNTLGRGGDTCSWTTSDDGSTKVC